jgi:hypothetical protein
VNLLLATFAGLYVIGRLVVSFGTVRRRRALAVRGELIRRVK